MVTKFLNVSTDAQLSENSNTLVPSQKAVRNFIASKAIQLDFIQSVAPTTYTAGQKWLNTSDNKLYTAMSSSSWGTGVSVETDQFFTYLDLLYYFDGTSVKSYSTQTITEQRAGAQLKTWLGTRAQYQALGGVYDLDTVYQVIESDSDYAILATQSEFNDGSTTRAATPYQVKQYSAGAYLPLTGGNLSAGAVLRLTNTNNQVTELAYNTSGYLTVSTGLHVTNTADVNAVVVRSGNIYKTSSTSGVTAVWTDTLASSSTFGIVKVDGSTIIANNGVISASGTTIAYDSALSTTSENAVQNKVINSALTGKVSTSGDTMTGTLTMRGSGDYTITSDASLKQLKIYGTDTSSRLGGLVIDSNGSENVLYHHNGSTIYRLVDASDKGSANGVASLDSNAKIPAAQIPAATSAALGGVMLVYDSATNTLDIRTVEESA